SLLVLTGVDTAQEALRADPVRRPTFILPDLAALADPFPLPVIAGATARCGGVRAVLDEAADEIRTHGSTDDPRVLRAVLALLHAYRPDSAWTGVLRAIPHGT